MIPNALKSQKSKFCIPLTALLASAALSVPSAWAAGSPVEDIVNFDAGNVEYDDANQKIIASGGVEVIQGDRIIKADRITYFLKTEIVRAEGNVALLEKNGDVHFADRVDLERSMRNGYVNKLRTVLADGSRFEAAEGHRVEGRRVEMTDASYTPCAPCRAHPEKAPDWRIKAKKVVHDNDDHTISYRHALFEVKGVPVAYVPYFSHPDGTINQKSGILPPTFSQSSELGFSATGRYYWAIDPSQDATFGLRAFAEQSPMLQGEYRKRFETAQIEFAGSTIYADRIDSDRGQYSYVSEELRGNLSGKGLWDINEKWRAGFDANVVSDDQYLRQFNISSDDVLENRVYTERFSGRDYGVVQALAFQDVRISDRAADQPNILPEAIFSFLGDPGESLGGRWSLDLSGLALTRDGNGQDVVRGSGTAGWERRDVLNIGLVNVISGSIRGDAYTVPKRDEDLLGSGDGDSTATRFYPVLHNVTSYPISSPVGSAQAVIEPTVSITAVQDSKNSADIPNEDSQDVQLNAKNLFDANRFPGLDRVEDESHATYGIRTGLHASDGSKGEVFIGQSHRFNDGNNGIFPDGSGLENRSSNYVGEINASYEGDYNLNYNFELSSDHLTSERHELSADALIGKLDLSTSYFFSKALEGTDLTESREQVYGNAGYYFAEDWRGEATARYDLSEESRGLRKAGLGLEYLGQCYTVSTSLIRNFTFESTGDNSTEILVRVGLKNLGEFGNGQ